MKMRKKERDDIEFEIQFYEGILKKRKNFVQALMALGDLYTKKGLFDKGLDIDLKLIQLRPDDPVVLYNLACSYSLTHKIQLAYKTMKSAIECGYDNFEHLESDSDLANLMKSRRFQQYLSSIKVKQSHQTSSKEKNKSS